MKALLARVMDSTAARVEAAAEVALEGTEYASPEEAAKLLEAVTLLVKAERMLRAVAESRLKSAPALKLVA